MEISGNQVKCMNECWEIFVHYLKKIVYIPSIHIRMNINKFVILN